MNSSKTIVAVSCALLTGAVCNLLRAGAPTTPTTPSSAKVEARLNDGECRDVAGPDAANCDPAKPGLKDREKVITAFASALAEKSGDLRMKGFLTLLGTLDASHAPAILDVLDRCSQDGQDVGSELAALGRRWGSIDPQGAIGFLDGLPEGDRKAALFEQVFCGWAKTDLVASKAWLSTRANHPHFEGASLGAVTGHAQKDLSAATTYAIETIGPNGRVMPKVLERLATLAAEKSADNLKTWFDLVPSGLQWGPLKSKLAGQVYDLLPRKDCEGNARWVSALTGSLYLSNNKVITNFAFDYAQTDPEAAMNWVNTTKPKPDINIIIGVIEIVRAWSEKDMAGLGRWLDAHRDSPIFNQATRDLAVIYADTDRELAKKWGEQNTDPKRRAFIDKLLSKPPKPQAMP